MTNTTKRRYTLAEWLGLPEPGTFKLKPIMAALGWVALFTLVSAASEWLATIL